MDTQSKYLAGLHCLLYEKTPLDPLKQVIRARLEGVREPVQGLVSPPLGRNEPDTSLLLLHLYDQLRLDQDWSAQDRLRRAAAELLEEALTAGADFRAINRLGQLVGAFEVRRSEPLAGRLRTWLWGHLEIGLPRPGEKLIELTGNDLIRARQVLDLWLAVTPALPTDWPEHYAGKIGLFFDKAVDQTRQGSFLLNKPRFHLLTLLYRGLLKLDPEYAGLQYPTLCRLAHNTRERDAQGIWLALCWEYGALLGAEQVWRGRFAQGLRSIDEDEKRRYCERSGSELNDLFWRGLEYLDHLERDLYPPKFTPEYPDLELADKPQDTAKPRLYSGPEPEKFYRLESTPAGRDLRVADESEDNTRPYAYSNSGPGKRHPLGAAPNLLCPLRMCPKPAAAGVQ